MKKNKFQPISTDPVVKFNSAFNIRTHFKSPSQPTITSKNQIRKSISSFEENTQVPNFMRSSTRRLSQGQILSFALKSQDVKDTDQFDDLISSPYDNQLQKFKYRNKVPELLRLEKIQSSIYDKKAQSQLKYSKSKINSKANPVQKGTMSIMLNAAKKDYGFNLQSFKKKIPPRSRFKMKWKTIQWLINNRKEAIKQIFQNYKLLLKYARSKKAGMKRDEFGELLSYVGLGADQSLTDKLFYIFDEDQSGTVDYKELIIGLKILNEDSIEDKLEIFFDLCDMDNNGNISQKEIYEVLKGNIASSEDRYKLKKVIARLFVECDENGDGVLDKQELYSAAKDNITLRQLLEESIRNLKQIDQIIKNDLEEPFHCWVPLSANFVNYKEGIHFPFVNKIIEVLKEIEDVRIKI